MAVSEAQKRATKKHAKSLRSISIRVKPELYDIYVNGSREAGLSFRKFILQAMDEKLERMKNER